MAEDHDKPLQLEFNFFAVVIPFPRDARRTPPPPRICVALGLGDDVAVWVEDR